MAPAAGVVVLVAAGLIDAPWMGLARTPALAASALLAIAALIATRRPLQTAPPRS